MQFFLKHVSMRYFVNKNDIHPKLQTALNTLTQVGWQKNSCPGWCNWWGIFFVQIDVASIEVWDILSFEYELTMGKLTLLDHHCRPSNFWTANSRAKLVLQTKAIRRRCEGGGKMLLTCTMHNIKKKRTLTCRNNIQKPYLDYLVAWLSCALEKEIQTKKWMIRFRSVLAGTGAILAVENTSVCPKRGHDKILNFLVFYDDFIRKATRFFFV